VIEAAIACVAEQGLRNATAGRIAERAGISWGGIQHQFGDKEAIFEAVLEQVLEDFSADLLATLPDRASLPARVSALVRGAWRLMSNPAYQAFREILRNRDDGVSDRLSSKQIMERVNAALDRVCAPLFGDLSLPAERVNMAKLVVFATLSGMAEQRAFTTLPPETTQEQLELLDRSVLGLVRRTRIDLG
jgi:AcrR family transcriptional regulator